MFIIVDILCLLCAVSSIESLEVVPERPVIDYINPKYISSMNLSMRRRSRHSPHYINLAVHSVSRVGNNMTITLDVLEALTAGYHPTPIQVKYKLCDFLYNEPFLGQMLAKQMPANWTCPFPAAVYTFENILIHLENFPYNIPFTSPSMIIKTRADVKGYVTDTNEPVFKVKFYVTVTQKPKKTY